MTGLTDSFPFTTTRASSLMQRSSEYRIFTLHRYHIDFYTKQTLKDFSFEVFSM